MRWTSAFDDYPIDAVEVRNELVRRAADEGWWCYFTHDPGDLPIQIEATEKGSFRVREPDRPPRVAIRAQQVGCLSWKVPR